MSRERNEEKKGLSPTQRKACVVLALCALAVVMSILAAWVLPTKLGLFAGGKDSYDPDAYPLDTTLDSILPQSAADDAYITASVFAGDQYAVTLQKDTRITLNQFVGQEGLQISKALSTSCVNFASDASRSHDHAFRTDRTFASSAGHPANLRSTHRARPRRRRQARGYPSAAPGHGVTTVRSGGSAPSGGGPQHDSRPPADPDG